MKKIFLVFLCLQFLVILGLNPAYAQDNAFSKLGRGAANTLTGWIEIPKNVYEISSKDHPLKGISLGLIKGLGLGIVRTAVGLYEVVTFPFPIPEHYGPIIKPEYVIEPETTEYAY